MTSIQRILIEVVICGLLAGGIVLYLEHRGAARIEAADAKAKTADEKKVAAETALNVEKATKADLGAEHDQQLIADYMAAHPDKPVRVCHPNNSVGQLPANKTANSGTQNPGSGSAAIPPVQDGTAGPDIGPGLAILVQAAATVDSLYRDRQER